MRHGAYYAQVHDSFLQQLHAAAGNLSIALRQQEGLVAALSQASQALKSSGENRPKRIQRLQNMFEQADMLGPLKSLASPLLMPLDPRLRIIGCTPSRAVVFKSALSPLGLTFETVKVLPAADPEMARPYAVIFKSGDDLRQDQLVLQLLMLMDKLLQAALRMHTNLCLQHLPCRLTVGCLWQEQGLDLKLTPYRVLATGPGQGFVERVPESLTLAQVINTNRCML